jgi:molecular chaperone DnaJ
MPGPNGVEAGDLYVELDVEEDPRFERDGVDIVTRVSVTFSDAALGAEIEVPSLEHDEKKVKVSLPPGTQPGSVVTVKGQGVPRLDGRGRGSMAVVVQVEVPTVLTERARTLLEELDREIRRESTDGVKRQAASGSK